MTKGRPPLPIGTWGAVNVANVGPARYKARARFRDATGQTRPVARYGQTKAEARRRLLEALATERENVQASAVTRSSTVADLATLWLTTSGGGKQWATRTAETYAYAIDNNVIPQLGAVQVAELRPPIIDGALQRISDTAGVGAAKAAKTVLSGMARLAIRHGALTANPVRESISLPSRRAAPRALTREQETDLADRLRSDTRAVALDLADLVDWMLGTGCRIGEACAARESVVTVTPTGSTWEINATLVRVKGAGLVIQPRTKTQAGWRMLALPSYLVAMLERRRPELRFESDDVLFPSPRANALRDPSNTAKDIRETLDRLGYGWVHSHTFRKTVATRLLDAGMAPQTVADQLGHSEPSVTLNVYAGRHVVSADAARVLDR